MQAACGAGRTPRLRTASLWLTCYWLSTYYLPLTTYYLLLATHLAVEDGHAQGHRPTVRSVGEGAQRDLGGVRARDRDRDRGKVRVWVRVGVEVRAR